MAPGSRAVVAVALSLVYLCRAVCSSEYLSPLTLFNNELSKQGCSSLSEWEEYECGKVSLFAVASPRPPRVTRPALPLRANDNNKQPEQIEEIKSSSHRWRGQIRLKTQLETREKRIGARCNKIRKRAQWLHSSETAFCKSTRSVYRFLINISTLLSAGSLRLCLYFTPYQLILMSR